MITVGSPDTMTPPCPVISPCRRAGRPPIRTLVDPMTPTSGPPTQTIRSPTTAAGIPPINTFTAPGPTIGPPTCGTTPLTSGQVCISVILAAKGIGPFFYLVYSYQVAANGRYALRRQRYRGPAYTHRTGPRHRHRRRRKAQRRPGGQAEFRPGLHRNIQIGLHGDPR